MKKLINGVDDVVVEQLQGMAAAHPELNINISPHYITRADALAGKVAIVSGGGSGHEPMHGGFVGMGMLTGACPGEVFTSPTPDQMYECGKAVDRGAGVGASKSRKSCPVVSASDPSRVRTRSGPFCSRVSS